MSAASKTAVTKPPITKVPIYDVAIVGSGAAGGMTAHVLTTHGLNVAMLEAGPLRSPADFPTHRVRRWNLPYRGLRGDYMTEWLASTDFLADDKEEPYAAEDPDGFEWVRVRAVGGKSLFWAGVVPRFSPDEFQPRDEYDARWPLKYEEIAPFYDRVEEMIGVTSTGGGAGAFPANKGLGQQRPNCAEVELKRAAEALPGRKLKVLPIPKAILPVDYRGRPRCHHCGPCWQGCDSGSKFDSLRVFVQKAEKTGKLTLLTGARVRSLELSGNRVQTLHYWDVQEQRYRELRARVFVLAAGCIESTQILLNSGIANSSGLVGHYLSEHLYGAVSGYLPQLMGRPVVNEDSNGANIFIPDLTRNWRGNRFLRGYQLYPTGGIPETTLVGLNIPGFGQAWKEKVRQYYPAECSVLMQGEVLPNFANRIEVDESLKDAAGIPGVRFHFAWRENERAMFQDFLEVGNEILKKAGAEVLPVRQPKPFKPGASIHYVGTARMGDDPKRSVVDRWNRAHDVPNLFIEDAATFVTAGNQNPTLTIMALALRSSEYLAERCSKGEV